MKKIAWLLTAALLLTAAASGQDQPKKKGGFWNKVKKGVESTTGLDVSKETLFVYPQLGQWKMEFVSATGNPSTGEVSVTIGIMPLAGQKSAFLKLTEVTDAAGRGVAEGAAWKATSKFRTSDLGASPLYHEDLAAGTYAEYRFQPIKVEPGMKSFKALKFTLETGNAQEEGFEARDVPVTWE
ncbi:hypothetical protein [Alistipes sp.]|uniref:hypothetical protein n=1 Tax=Alistipes sp. TaxID=1872444 RepID=UPI003AEF5686